MTVKIAASDFDVLSADVGNCLDNKLYVNAQRVGSCLEMGRLLLGCGNALRIVSSLATVRDAGVVQAACIFNHWKLRHGFS
jgi:hypothetical protein